MNPTQATMLAAKLREAFPAWGWNDLRFALYADNLAPYPFPEAAAVVDELVRNWPTTQAPAVGHLTKQIEARLARAKAITDQQEERRLLAAPRDPAVQALLRATVTKLERRAAAGSTAPPAGDAEPDRREIIDPRELSRRRRARRRLQQQAESLRNPGAA